MCEGCDLRLSPGVSPPPQWQLEKSQASRRNNNDSRGNRCSHSCCPRERAGEGRVRLGLEQIWMPGRMPVVSICFRGVSACFFRNWYMSAKRARRFIVLWHLTEIIQWTWPEGWFKKKREKERKKKFLGFTGLFKACLLHFSPLLSCPFFSFWPL